MISKKSDYPFLPSSERSALLNKCYDILDDNQITVIAHKFKTKEDYEHEVIRAAYEHIRSLNGKN